MVTKFEGQTAVITGGGSGIGRGFAFALAKRGVNIAVVGRDRDRIERVAAELVKETKVKAAAFPLDVGDHEGVERLAEQVYERFGAVHVLANNAAISTVGNAWETSLADWEQVIRVTSWGPCTACARSCRGC